MRFEELDQLTASRRVPLTAREPAPGVLHYGAQPQPADSDRRFGAGEHVVRAPVAREKSAGKFLRNQMERVLQTKGAAAEWLDVVSSCWARPA